MAKEQNDSPTAFVFDDSPLGKRCYKIEGVSRIWNHVIQKSVLGYQLLVMGYFNRTTLLPVNFSLHREKGKNKKKLFGLKPSHYKKQYVLLLIGMVKLLCYTIQEKGKGVNGKLC